MLRRARARIAGLALVVLTAVLATAGASCLENEGIPPFRAELHYPTALEGLRLDAAAPRRLSHLVVVNSDFDLRFNAAAVQTFDLDALNSAIDANCDAALPAYARERCAVVPEEAASHSLSIPTITAHTVQGLFLSEVLISAYADGVTVAPGGHRVYIPVRGNADLTRIEIDPTSGLLSCGGTGVSPRCTSEFTTTIRTARLEHALDTPTDPVDLVSGSLADFGLPAELGEYVLAAHRSGAVSFFYVPTTTPPEGTPGVAFQPVLTDTLLGLPTNLVTLTRNPGTSTFFAPSGTSTYLPTVTVAVAADGMTTDEQAKQVRDYTRVRVGPGITLKGLDTGSTANANIRQVLVDPRTDPAHAGLLYAVSRAPEALVTLEPDSETGGYDVVGLVQLGTEPSRMRLATIAGRLLAFVTCYVSRRIDVIDVDAQRKIAVVAGLSGPFEFIVDESRLDGTTPAPRLYVADFKSSVIRVIDLQPLATCLADSTATTYEACSPVVRGMLGIPNAVQELK